MEKEACDHSVGIDFVGLPLQIYKELPGDLARLRSYWRNKEGAFAEDRKNEEKPTNASTFLHSLLEDHPIKEKLGTTGRSPQG